MKTVRNINDKGIISNAHHLVVKTVGAVEDDTLLGQWFGKILGGLCLPSASWTSRRSSKVEL